MKKDIVYEVKESAVELCGETVLSYGIECLKEGRTILCIEDISTDRTAVEKLTDLCNRLELEPGQLTDVAEDFIS